MPELPEVEVVKKSLESQINNLIIKKVQVNDGNLRYEVKKRDINKIINQKILRIKRRSKYLLFFLTRNISIIIHLGMTGKFFILNKNLKRKKLSFYYEEEDYSKKHNRLIFFFNNNLKLIYNDIRKFGFIKVVLTKDLNTNFHLKLLGPEPLKKNFNFHYFKNYIIKRRRTIKNLLMDQKFVSGLGNIYVNEILFLSRIKPKRKIDKLNNQEINKIIINTKKILKKAIEFGGSSIKNFLSSAGKKGNFQQHFNVYGKKGYNCPNIDCNAVIKKITIDNRASFFCSKCQK